MRQPVESTVTISDQVLAVYEWQGTGDPILLLHATGFHSRCWNQVVGHLPGLHIYAVDVHYHGGSGDAGGTVDWNIFAEDIRELIVRLGLQKLVGVGHSMGGYLVARIATLAPERFKQLVLIDPVIFSPETYADLQSVFGSMDARDHPVSRRKNNWRDADEMYRRFRDRRPFDSWQPEVLRDYCDYALRPADDADFLRLACDPINEASNYLSHAGNEVVLRDLPNLRMPVTLLRAPPGELSGTDLSNSPTWPGLADALPNCREVYLPRLNHFIPMQDPALVARYIEEAQGNGWHHPKGAG